MREVPVHDFGHEVPVRKVPAPRKRNATAMPAWSGQRSSLAAVSPTGAHPRRRVRPSAHLLAFLIGCDSPRPSSHLSSPLVSPLLLLILAGRVRAEPRQCGAERVRGVLHMDHLAGAMKAVVREHEALRTRCANGDDGSRSSGSFPSTNGSCSCVRSSCRRRLRPRKRGG